LGFEIETETRDALLALRDSLNLVAGERLYVETTRTLTGHFASQTIVDYVEVLGAFMPELLAMKDFDQMNPHHVHDVLTHSAHVVSFVKPEPVMRWAALLHDAGKPAVFKLDKNGVGHFRGHAEGSVAIAQGILERLKAGGVDKASILTLIKHHDDRVAATPSSVRRMLNVIGVDAFRDLMEFKRADNRAQTTLLYDRTEEYDCVEDVFSGVLRRGDCFTLSGLAINGDDAVGIGLSGRAVGDALRDALERVMDGDISNNVDDLMNFLRKKSQDRDTTIE
jgi:tRNA nucleotidyltransferase (CCA-adding enzyme)